MTMLSFSALVVLSYSITMLLLWLPDLERWYWRKHYWRKKQWDFWVHRSLLSWQLEIGRTGTLIRPDHRRRHIYLGAFPGKKGSRVEFEAYRRFVTVGDLGFLGD